MKPVIINFKELKTGTYHFNITLTSQELELEDIEFKLTSPISTHIRIYKNRNNYEMEIQSHFKLLLTCSRCLKEFESDFSEKDNFYLKQNVEGLENLENESTFSDEDAYTIFFQDEQLDIAPLIREQVILSLPLRPLCSDNCQIPEYKSEVEKIDPRWQKLLELKNKI
ncbi:MAG: DUF177 domain-containing protein [candidate division WOR-3 bacterium]